MKYPRNSFNAGEWSPRLTGRNDIEKYGAACKILENWRPIKYGGIEVRQGMEYKGAAYSATTKSRIYGFNYSTNDRYIVEFADRVIRFWKDGVLLMSGGSPYEVVSNYVEADLFDLHFLHLNDVLYIVHPAHSPAKLTRTADTLWTLVEIDYGNHIAWEEENTDNDVVMTPNALTGTGVRIEASSGTPFASTQLGERIRLIYTQPDNNEVLRAGPLHIPNYYDSSKSTLYGIDNTDRILASTLPNLSPHERAGYPCVWRIRNASEGIAGGELYRVLRRYKVGRDDTLIATYTKSRDYAEAGTHPEVSQGFQAPINIVSVSAASPSVVKISGVGNDYDNGDIIKVEGTGNTEIDGNEYVIDNIDKTADGSTNTTFELTNRERFASSDKEVTSATGAVGTVKRKLGPWFAIGLIAVEPKYVTGAWAFSTSGSWVGEWIIQRSEDGITWTNYRTFFSNANANFSTSGDESRTPTYMRLLNTKHWHEIGVTGYGHEELVTFDLPASDKEGHGIVTAVIDDKNIEVTVERTLPELASTSRWSMNHWNPRNGYPRTIRDFENRIWYAGTKKAPQTFWASRQGDYDKMRIGPLDTDALEFSLLGGEQNPIQWMHAERLLVIGTSGSEFIVTGGEDESITPTNIKTRRFSSFGSKNIQAIQVNDVTVFFERLGLGMRELVATTDGYSQSYQANDLTQLAEHIFGKGIVQATFKQQKDAEVYVVRSDGQVAVMIFERTEGVIAWYRLITDGEVESIATIYGADTDDDVYLVVKRNVNGADVRHVEKLAVTSDPANRNYIHLDAAVTASGSGLTSIDCTHLEGKKINVIGDGGTILENHVVTGGIVTFTDTPVNYVVAGLPFTSYVVPMPPDIQGTRGSIRSVSAINFMLYQSLGVKFGVVGSNREYTIANHRGDEEVNTAPPLITEHRRQTMPPKSSREVDIYIKADTGHPATILGMDYVIEYPDKK